MKFVHIADVHLGAQPDQGYSWSEQRKQEIWDSFRETIEQVGQERADLLLIAGDLFHRQPLVRELKEVNYLFESIPDTKIVLIAGNHDCLKKDSYYRTFPWSSNVVCLFGETLEQVYLKDIDTYIYGLSYHSQEIKEGLCDTVRPQTGKGGIHILLAHGGDENHMPFKKQLLAASGFDYIALGHIHKPQILVPNKIAFSGALEPLDRNDIGIHGYFTGTCRDGETTIYFRSQAKRTYIPLVIQVSEETTQFSLEEQVSLEIELQGQKNIYQIILEGFRDTDLNFDKSRLQALGNIIEILDDTQASFDLESIKIQYEGSLVGEYIAYFQERDRTIVENKALTYGLQALLNEK